MPTDRLYYRYEFTIKDKIIEVGLTYDFDRREEELQKLHGSQGTMLKRHWRVSYQAAYEWEKQQLANNAPVRTSFRLTEMPNPAPAD